MNNVSCLRLFALGGPFILIGNTAAYFFSAVAVACRLHVHWETDHGIDAFTRDRHVIFPFHIKILALLMLTELNHSLVSAICYYLILNDRMNQGGRNYAIVNGLAWGIDNVVLRRFLFLSHRSQSVSNFLNYLSYSTP